MSKRLNFFLTHLVISIFILILVILFVFLVWYPFPLAKAVGVIHVLLILIIIDIIIGPVLALFIYKEKKKTLKFDLIIIILVQVFALIYGLYSIAQGRPVWGVYSIDHFELVRNNEIIDNHIQQAQKKYRNSSLFKFQLVAAEFSKNKETDEIFQEMFGGGSITQKPEHYVELSKARSQIQQYAKSLDYLEKYNNQVVVKQVLAKYPQANAFVPLKANAVDMTVLINKEKGEVIKIVDLRPWK